MDEGLTKAQLQELGLLASESTGDLGRESGLESGEPPPSLPPSTSIGPEAFQTFVVLVTNAVLWELAKVLEAVVKQRFGSGEADTVGGVHSGDQGPST